MNKELKAQAAGVFNAHPQANKLLYTEDGNFFLEDKANAANAHAKDKGLTVRTISRDAVSLSQVEDKAPAQPKGENKPAPAGDQDNTATDDNGTNTQGGEEPEVEITESAEQLMKEEGLTVAELLEYLGADTEKIVKRDVQAYLKTKSNDE